MSIFGKYIVITRTAEQAQPFIQALTRSHAHPVLFPCLQMVPTLSAAYLTTISQQLQAGHYDWLVVTSSNAVQMIQQQCANHHVAWHIPAHVRIAAVGQQTAQIIQQYWHRTPDFVPTEHNAHALVSGFHTIRPHRVCWFTTPTAPNHFHDAPFFIERIDVYKNETVHNGADFRQLLSDQHVDVVTWHSGSAVHAFIERLIASKITRHHLSNVVYAAFGKSTYDACHHIGITPHIYTPDMTLTAWMDALHTHFDDYGAFYGLSS
jgi:uroporphyrinogen-III synthase